MVRKRQEVERPAPEDRRVQVPTVPRDRVSERKAEADRVLKALAAGENMPETDPDTEPLSEDELADRELGRELPPRVWPGNQAPTRNLRQKLVNASGRPLEAPYAPQTPRMPPQAQKPQERSSQAPPQGLHGLVVDAVNIYRVQGFSDDQALQMAKAYAILECGNVLVQIRDLLANLTGQSVEP